MSVDPTSTDDTADLAATFAKEDDRFHVVLGEAGGKGAAIRAGVAGAEGSTILTCDADLAVDPSEFSQLVEPATRGFVAIASRSVSGSSRQDEPLLRLIAGRGFNALARVLVLPGIHDSQCGFKAFPRDVGETLLAQTTLDGWVFDVEFLALARRAGVRVQECPVAWQYCHGSTVRVLRDAAGVLRDLWLLRRRLGRVKAAGTS